jgi:phosphoribosylcarboxyaminoimidazole (NCAIR) mutase
MPPRAALEGGRKIMNAQARKILVLAAVAGLTAALAGCVSDAAAPSVGSSDVQLRYYGGPKSPMWSEVR